MPAPLTPRRRLLLAGCVVLVVQGLFLVLGGAARFPSFPLDDAWIHQTYARSIAQGRGFAYAGGAASAGCSSPLWVLLLALPAWLGMAPVAAGTALSCAFTIAAIAAAAALAHRLVARLAPSETRDAVAPLAVIVAGTSPILAWNAGAGMEGPATAAAVLGALYLRLEASNGKRRAGALLLGVGAALRLEVVTVLPLLALDGLLSSARTPRSARVQGVLADLLLFAAPLAAVLSWVHASTGRFLPQTLEAKVGDRALWELFTSRSAVFPEIAERLVAGVVSAVRIATLDTPFTAAALGLLVLAVLRLRVPRGPLVLPVGLLVLSPLAMELLPSPGGALYHEGRYVVHLELVASVLVAVGLSLCAGLFTGAQRGLRAVRVVIGAVTVAAFLVTGVQAALRAAANRREIASLQVSLGRWLSAAASPGDAIAARDVGAAGYFAERARIVDLYGLVSPEWHAARSRGVPFTRGADVRYVEVFLGEWPAFTRDCTERARRVEPLATSASRTTMVVYDCPARSRAAFISR